MKPRNITTKKKQIQKRKFSPKVFLACLVAVYLTAIIGSFFTSSSTNSDWYQSIKPSITPPGYVFPIVWNILYLMIAISLYFAWTSSNPSQKQEVFLVFSVNLFLNILWSFFYFYLQNPLFALYSIFILILSILSMIIVCYGIDKKSSFLLVPYFIWVCFATILNILSIG